MENNSSGILIAASTSCIETQPAHNVLHLEKYIMRWLFDEDNPLIAIFFKCADQIMGDHLSRPSFNLVTFYEMHQLSIFK